MSSEQRISHKTFVRDLADGRTEVVYYGTAIVQFDDREILLNTGDWWTRSTKSRMNLVSRHFNLDFQVISKSGIWYVIFQRISHQFAVTKIRLDRKTGAVTPYSY